MLIASHHVVWVSHFRHTIYRISIMVKGGQLYMDNQNKGILHCHSESSVKDSGMRISELVARAKEMGAPAVALTDHGLLTGIFKLMSECQKAGIKAIPGVEAYVFADRDSEDKIKPVKRHMVLMAKNIDGYRAISKAVTEAYKLASKETPRMDHKLLRKYFGAGSAGHGNVIATSACMNGILAEPILGDEIIKHEIEKIKRRRDKYQPVNNEFLDALKEKEEREEELAALLVRREALTADSKINVNGLARKLKTVKDDGERGQLQDELEELTRKKTEATSMLAGVRAEIAKKKSSLTAFSKNFKSMEQSVNKWEAENERISEIEASIKPDAERYAEAKADAETYRGIFGDGNFFIELQYHGIAQEERCMPLLARLAKELGIPVVAANDAHYARREDAYANELVRAMRFNQPITDEKEEGYGELYLKTDDELRESLLKILDAKVVDEAMSNIDAIVDGCDVVFPKGEHYPLFKGGVPGETTAMRLRRLAQEGIERRYPNPADFTQAHKDRLAYEHSIIDQQGFNDYLCIVQDIIEYARGLEKKNKYGFGYYVGPGRGSAVGSLVCYLAGITSVDPMKYGLLFERFLNPERVSQPDIDTDFHTEMRGEVRAYICSKYGEGAVCSILTKGTMAAKLAVRNTARVTGVPLGIADEVCRIIPKTPKTKLSLDRPEDSAAKTKLDRACNDNPVIAKLIEDAKLVEGTVSDYGMHAAGLIISDNDDVTDHIPMMYNFDKNQWVSQCDMGEAEKEAGLLKMDLLGLKNINVINESLHRNFDNCGLRLDIESVPFEDAVFSEIFARGRTNSMFQFESSGMKELLKNFRPSSFEDLILLVAAYRPGPMQYLDDIIAVKHGRKKPQYLVPQFKEILEPTYGSPIYQEQIMQIFNKVAGFSLGEADIIRRAMSKKKMEILTDPVTDYKGKFIRGLAAAGANEHHAERFWTEILDFADYAFNKSHAAAYALIAYFTAYLKYHYTPEFMCSVMARTAREKIPPLLAECRSMGLTIRQPNVNVSEQHYSNSGDVITFGFSSILGVSSAGKEIAEERSVNGAYGSVKDVISRIAASVDGKKAIANIAVIEALIGSGAFDSFCGGNRSALTSAISELTDLSKKLATKEKEINVLKGLLASGKQMSEKEIKATEKKIATREKASAELKQRISAIVFVGGEENKREKLDKEKELLGCYVSGHPLDDYDEAIKALGAETIDQITDGDVRVCGIVSGLQIKQRKKDGADLGFFTLSDKTDEIPIKCWSREFEEYRELIFDDAVIELEGTLRTEIEANENGEDFVVERSISVRSVKPLRMPRHGDITIAITSVMDWADRVYDAVRLYSDEFGHGLVVHDTMLDEMRKASFRVSPDLLTAGIEGVSFP